MKLFYYLLALFILSSFAYADGKVIKILPLGDSISCASTQKLSYRYPLWKSLIDRGKEVSFIGSQDYNQGRTWEHYKGASFPPANEAHSGWRTDQILQGLDNGTVGLPSWLVHYNPDIVLIHLGTNDLYQSQSPQTTVKEIEQIITLLRKKNPKIKVLLAKIIPMGKRGRYVPQLNQLIGRLAIQLNTKISPVHSVDMYSGMSIYHDLEKDRIHPNASGELKLAQRWLAGLINNHYL